MNYRSSKVYKIRWRNRKLHHRWYSKGFSVVSWWWYGWREKFSYRIITFKSSITNNVQINFTYITIAVLWIKTRNKKCFATVYYSWLFPFRESNDGGCPTNKVVDNSGLNFSAIWSTWESFLPRTMFSCKLLHKVIDVDLADTLVHTFLH